MRSLFAVFLILLASLVSTGPVQPLSAADLYHGQVVDEETGQPLVGAVITVIWSKAPLVHLASPRYFQSAQETVTDSQGKFELLVSPGVDWNPFTFVINEPEIVIYQPGYEPVYYAWLVRMRFKSHAEFAAALKKGFVVKLSKLKTEAEKLQFVGFSRLVLGIDIPSGAIPLLKAAINRHSVAIGIPPAFKYLGGPYNDNSSS